MSAYLSSQPQVLALLQEAKEHPEDDTPRLVLADWLEEHGDPDRAEFIRLQCRLAPGSPMSQDDVSRERAQRLLNRHGGAWLGSLWRWWISPIAWHRGLLYVKLPRHVEGEDIEDILPWLASILVEVTGRRAFRRVVRLLTKAQVNHLYLDFRPRVREQTVLEVLSQVEESSCLRSLTIDWPMGLLHRSNEDGEPAPSPTVSLSILERLVELPLARHLTHLGSAPALTPAQADTLCQRGIEPIHAKERLWTHALAPMSFRRCHSQASSRPP